jgi:hypothetical protein
MKYIILIATLLPSCLYAQIKYFEKGDTLIVLAKSGLSLRDSASLSSYKIAVASFGQKVVVTGTEYYGDYIDDRYGSWIEVIFQGKVGFMFSGYLSYLKLPNQFVETPGCCRYPYLEEIVRLNVDSLVGKGERVWKSFGEKGGRSAKWELYKDGTLIQYMGYYESMDLVVETYDITMYDILNLMEYYLANLPECCKNPEIGPYKIDIVKESKHSYLESIKCEKLWFSAKAAGDKIVIVSNIYDL